MYGKLFETLYESSMAGSGSATFAVWCYVISKMRPDDVVGAQVHLQPIIMAAAIGEKIEIVEAVIEKLCGPDPKSTNQDLAGARLVKIGQFDYQVVNGKTYMNIRNEQELRAYFRRKKQEQRERDGAKKKLKNVPTLAEQQACAEGIAGG